MFTTLKNAAHPSINRIVGKFFRAAVPNVPIAGGIMIDFPCAKQPPPPPGPAPKAVGSPLRLATVSGPKALAALKHAVANAALCEGERGTTPPGEVCVQATLLGTLKSAIALTQYGIEFWLDLKSLTLPKKSQCSPRAAGMLFASLVPE